MPTSRPGDSSQEYLLPRFDMIIPTERAPCLVPTALCKACAEELRVSALIWRIGLICDAISQCGQILAGSRGVAGVQLIGTHIACVSRIFANLQKSRKSAAWYGRA